MNKEINTGMSLVLKKSSQINEQEELHFLTDAELLHYDEEPPLHKHDWLLGRLSAKEAVQNFMAADNIFLSLDQIEIENTDNGVPFFTVRNRFQYTNDLPNAYISISHCNGIAIAGCVDATDSSGFGVDVEKIRSFSNETAVGFMNKKEYNLFQQSTLNRRDFFATQLWTIKESFLKAVGTGLRTHPNKVFVDVNESGFATVLLKDNLPILHPVVTWECIENSYIISCTKLQSFED